MLSNSRKGNLNDLMKVLNVYIQGKASSVSVINNLIYFFFKDNKKIDISLHLLNETILHKKSTLVSSELYQIRIFEENVKVNSLFI